MLHYVLFNTIEEAKKLYGMVKAEGIKSTFAPAPRLSDSQCCGISILYYDNEDTAKIRKLAEENNISIFRIVDKEKDFQKDRMKFC